MKAILAAGFWLVAAQVPAASPLWSSSSKDFGEGRADFTLREVERRPRSSVLQLDVKTMGSSVGSSMLIACMLTRLAEERGGYRYLVKVDERPGNPKQMLVGFSNKPGEAPKSIDPELAATAMEVDLEVFGAQFNKSCRTKKE
jgi:hypothetical protein